MNRIKVVNDVADLVPILRAVDSEVKKTIFLEVAQTWLTAKQVQDKWGEEGLEALRFFEKMKLVETKWQTGQDDKGRAVPEKAYHAFYGSFHINASSPINEISDVLAVAMMPEERYRKIEERLDKMVGDQGMFAGDVADGLQVTQTTLKALVKRSGRLDFRGHRIIRFEE
ncbi:MAG TPA: ArsR family transcriptional regulator [Thermoplasmata archaeon]|nr:ArsR family transcriptional regulator [Thermoplasmata archaeon]